MSTFRYVLTAAFLIVIAIVTIRVNPHGSKVGNNLLLITMDTVRADRLHCYGYEGIETPTIDHLATNGVLFENAVSPAPITLPSHTTLLTGLYPNIHGVRDNTTYRLSDRATTLAEMLRDNGYSTGAVVGAFVLDSGYGLDQGFTSYDDDLRDPATRDEMVLASPEGNRLRMTKIAERTASTVTKKAVSWLRAHSDERFFLWVHYYDPHLPYRPPPPYSTDYAKDLYSGEIAFVDHNLSWIIKELEERNILDKTLIVLTSDHGENLGEHEEQTHGIFIYESSVRVPLILYYPGTLPTGVRINSVVSLADVTPTILDILGVKSKEQFSGTSLLGVMHGVRGKGRAVYCESMFPYLNYGWSKMFGIRDSRWKYIKAPIPELYDIIQDPSELNNLVEAEKEVAVELEDRLNAMISKTVPEEMNPAESARLSSEDRDRLLALGYISGAPPAGQQAALRDPKEMIHYHELLHRGEKAMQGSRFEEALEAFGEVVQGDSSNAWAHSMIGTIYYQRRDTAMALHEFQVAVELNPDLVTAHRNLANVYFHQKNYSEAADHYRRAIELDPSEGEYYIALAGIYEKTGDFQRSADTYDQAARQGCSSPQLPWAQAGMLTRIGRLDEAKEKYEEAIRSDPGNVQIYDEFGTLLDRMGNTAAAIAAYEKAVTLNPDFTSAHFNLARVLIKTGRKYEAIDELNTTIQKNPVHSQAHYLLGELYFERGEKQKAKENFKRFLELGTPNEVARQHAESRLAELR